MTKHTPAMTALKPIRPEVTTRAAMPAKVATPPIQLSIAKLPVPCTSPAIPETCWLKEGEGLRTLQPLRSSSREGNAYLNVIGCLS